jgi:heme exporter protein B
LLKDIIRNLKKDLKIEFRNSSALNISMAFAGISTLAISLATGGVPFSVKLQAVVLWIIMFFSAMNGLAHIFTREEEERTSLFLRLNTSLESIFLSKLIFNFLFFLVLQMVVCPLYIFFLQIEVKSPFLFMLIVFSGGISISSATTILGAMVSKAGGKGSLFTVISFPIILPVLWIAISKTSEAMGKAGASDYGTVIFFLAFSGVIISLSFLLFRYIWVEE